MKKVFLRGRSMHPFLKEGDILWIEKKPLEEIKKGSIIAYKRNEKGKSIAHRVIKVVESCYGRMFITKGDNCFTLDDPVYSHQILGKVVMRLRKGTFISITRKIEFMSLILGRIYLRTRRLLSPLLTLSMTLLSPFLHFRIISFTHNASVLAVVNGKAVGFVKKEDLWVHPFFKRTRVMKMLIRKKR